VVSEAESLVMSSKYAFGFSDRSGFRYPLDDLVEQFINGVPSGLLVGKDEVDIDHEQLRIGEVETNDEQSLKNPRIDNALIQSRALSSFKPVGLNMPNMRGLVGRVTVTTS